MIPTTSPWLWPDPVPTSPTMSNTDLALSRNVNAAISNMSAASVLRQPEELMTAMRTTYAANSPYIQGRWKPDEAIALIRACRSYQDSQRAYANGATSVFSISGAPWTYITKLVKWPAGCMPRDPRVCKTKMMSLRSTWVKGGGIDGDVLAVLLETRIFGVLFGCDLARQILRPFAPPSLADSDDDDDELAPPVLPSAEKKRPRQQICAAPALAPNEEQEAEVHTASKKQAVCSLTEVITRDMNETLRTEQTLLDEDMVQLRKIMASIEARSTAIQKTKHILAALAVEATPSALSN